MTAAVRLVKKSEGTDGEELLPLPNSLVWQRFGSFMVVGVNAVVVCFCNNGNWTTMGKVF